MLFREVIAVYCKNSKHLSALCGQNAQFVLQYVVDTVTTRI